MKNSPIKKKITQAKPKVKRIKIKRVKKAAIPIAVVATGLHNLVLPKGAHKPRKLLGRGPGSGHGKTSTRGSKGQTSRAGRDFYPGFEGGQSPLIRRFPKRGFTSRTKNDFQIVNLDQLNRIKESNINPEVLAKLGLIKNKDLPVKILGDGELKTTLLVQAHAISKQAAEKIQQAGGKVELL